MPLDPRRLSLPTQLLLISLSVWGLLGFGLYLQHVVGLTPCPMCIVQRYALVLIGLSALGASVLARSRARPVLSPMALGLMGLMGLRGLMSLMGLSALGGLITAVRQSWLQWNPPPVSSCGPDFYALIDTFPLAQALPRLFQGSGDCSQVDWRFLGGSLANWSALAFLVYLGLSIWAMRRAMTHTSEG